jgi:hypothetical protein
VTDRGFGSVGTQATLATAKRIGRAFANGWSCATAAGGGETTTSRLHGDAAASLDANARGRKTTGRWVKRDVTPRPRSGELFGQMTDQ